MDNNYLVAIDISYKGIQGVSFQHNHNIKKILDIHEIFYADMKDSDLGEHLLPHFIEKYFPNNEGIYINIPYEAHIIREFNIPFNDRKKIKQTLPFELESLIAYPLDEIVYDYYSNFTAVKDKTKINVIASIRSNIIPYLTMLKNHHITLKGIYSPLDALFQLFKLTKLEHGVMLHVSSLNSMLVFVENRQFTHARIIPIGYNILLQDLLKDLSKKFKQKTDQLNSSITETVLINMPHSYDKTEIKNIQKNLNISKEKATLFVKNANRLGEKLSTELNISFKSINQYLYSNLKTSSILITSDIEQQHWIRSILSNKLDIPVKLYPYEETPLATLNKKYILNYGEILTQKEKSLQFFDKYFKQYVWQEKSSSVFRTNILVAILASLFWVIPLFLSYLIQLKNLDNLNESNISEYQKYFSSVAKIEAADIVPQANKKLKSLQKKTEIFTKFFNKRKFSTILNNINEVIPVDNSVEVKSIIYNKKTIRLNGYAQDANTLSSIEASVLEKKDSNGKKVFEKIKCNKRNSPGNKGQNRWSFNCSIEITSQTKEK